MARPGTDFVSWTSCCHQPNRFPGFLEPPEPPPDYRDYVLLLLVRTPDAPDQAGDEGKADQSDYYIISASECKELSEDAASVNSNGRERPIFESLGTVSSCR